LYALEIDPNDNKDGAGGLGALFGGGG